MRRLLAPALALLAGPALAAEGKPFFSLGNTDFVVLIAFLIFVGILVYFRVPGMIGRMLDQRAETIRSELAEARALREEAQALLASYERKSREVAVQAERIVAQARDEAERAAAAAKDEIAASVARRVAAAEEKLRSAEQAALREVRDRAIAVAVAAARDVLSAQITPARSKALIDAAIETVEAKLH